MSVCAGESGAHKIKCCFFIPSRLALHSSFLIHLLIKIVSDLYFSPPLPAQNFLFFHLVSKFLQGSHKRSEGKVRGRNEGVCKFASEKNFLHSQKKKSISAHSAQQCKSRMEYYANYSFKYALEASLTLLLAKLSRFHIRLTYPITQLDTLIWKVFHFIPLPRHPACINIWIESAEFHAKLTLTRALRTCLKSWEVKHFCESTFSHTHLRNKA